MEASERVARKFKTLMYSGQYVDTSRLGQGIYFSVKPSIYDYETDIESIENQGKELVDVLGDCFISKKYFKNLRKCKLVDIELTIKD